MRRQHFCDPAEELHFARARQYSILVLQCGLIFLAVIAILGIGEDHGERAYHGEIVGANEAWEVAEEIEAAGVDCVGREEDGDPFIVSALGFSLSSCFIALKGSSGQVELTLADMKEASPRPQYSAGGAGNSPTIDRGSRPPRSSLVPNIQLPSIATV